MAATPAELESFIVRIPSTEAFIPKLNAIAKINVKLQSEKDAKKGERLPFSKHPPSEMKRTFISIRMKAQRLHTTKAQEGIDFGVVCYWNEILCDASHWPSE